MLLAAKVFGIVGLIVGVTQYRVLGGVLLGLDGALLAFAVGLALKNMKSSAAEERDQKQVLEQMIREGTLDQFLRDLRDTKGLSPKGTRREPSRLEPGYAKL